MLRSIRIKALPARFLPTSEQQKSQQTKSLVRRLTDGIAWSLVAQVSAQGATFLSNIFVANLVGRTTYGQYATVVGTLLSISSLAQLATGYTSVKYLAELRTVDPVRAGRVVGVCSLVSSVSAIIATIAVLACSPWLASSVFRAPTLAIPLAIGSLFLGFSIVNGFQIGALTGLEAFRQLGKASLVSGTIVVLSCSGFAHFFGVTGAVGGLVLASIVRWGVFNYYFSKELQEHGIPTNFKGFRQERDVFIRFALPAALCGLSVGPSQWLGSVALVRQPHGFSEMALFNAAYSLLIMVLFVPRVADRVAMARINFHRGIRDQRGYRTVFLINLCTTLGITLIGGLAALLFGPFLLRLFGKSFVAAGSQVLFYFILGAFPEGLLLAMYQLLQSNEKMWTVMLGVNLPRDVLFPILAFLLAHQGAVGLAKAYLASVSLACAFSVILASRTGLQARYRDDTPVYVSL